jgi:folylpolyglutamate synthase/dihydropteroate synthase
VAAGILPPEAKKVIKQTARENEAAVTFTERVKILSVDYKKGVTKFCYKGGKYALSLIGAAQAQNAAIVLECAAVLGVCNKFCKQAFRDIYMPWRFEVSPFGRKFIIKDGAHNPAAVKEFLLNYKASPYYAKDNTLIYASSSDKDYKFAARALAPLFNNVILTSASKDRGVAPRTLQKYFKKGAPLPAATVTKKLLRKSPGNIVVLGSFYLSSQIPSI